MAFRPDTKYEKDEQGNASFARSEAPGSQIVSLKHDAPGPTAPLLLKTPHLARAHNEQTLCSK